MRLSWYGDTGVAVFSIWQGGRCTGTFRLPTGDLARMIDTLREGPAGQADAAHPAAARPAAPQRAAGPPDATAFESQPFESQPFEPPAAAGYEPRPYGPGGSGQYDVPAARGSHGAGYDDEREPRGRRARLPGDADGPGYVSGPRTGSYAADFPPAAPARGDAGGRDPGLRDRPADLPPAPRPSSRQQPAPHIRPEDPLGLGYQRDEKPGYRDTPEYHAAPPQDYRPAADYRPREGRDYPGGDYEYPESGGYREPAGYEPGGYPEPSRYPDQPGYGADPAPYGDSGYREPAGYADPGYREGGYPEGGGYGDPGYPEGEPRRRHGSRSGRSEPRLADPARSAGSAAGLVPGFPEPDDRTDPGEDPPPGFDQGAPSPGRRRRQP